RVRWFANGREVASWTSSRVASVPASLKFTVQMGGLAGEEVEEKALPDDLLVDWVRVWQRTSAPGEPEARHTGADGGLQTPGGSHNSP
ncbi:MAG: glycoside hydrolase family 16, partial [Myxococcaceae bacterium]|nr:glycoside hydrolase family 16 [Myxococcaceae bacterium]